MFRAVLAPPDQGFGARPDAGATGLERQGSMAGSGRKIHHVELDDDERRFPAGNRGRREGVGGTPQARPSAPAGRPGFGEDGGRTDADIASVLGIGTATVERVRRQCVLDGLEAALERKAQLNRKRRTLDGAGEAELVKLACSSPPDGRARWTLQLLGDRLVELHVVESISTETVRRDAEKNCIKPWLKKTWCIPPKANADFACAMEDVLDTYSRDFEDGTVLVCLDEASKQQVRETRTPLPPLPGKPAGHDYECERNGTANMFMIHAPLLAWRHVEITDRRTKQDFAPRAQGHRRRSLPRQADRPCDGQPEHPPAFDALRDLRPGGGTAHRGPLRDSLHAEAWQLAQHGRGGNKRPAQSMPRPPDPGPGDAVPRGRGMAA